MSDDIAAVTLRQYREVTQFFKNKWMLIEGVPVMDDVISMWFSYPYWSRCQELLLVLNVLFGLTVVGSYNPNFTDEVDAAMPVDTLRSSLHLVRSWFSKMFAGHTRQSLTGLLRVCSTNDMQVSTSTVPIDDYRSSVLAQLDLVEVLSPPRAGRRSSPVAMVSAKSNKSARRQSDVALGIGVSTSAPLVSQSKKSAAKSVRGASCDMSSASRGGSLSKQSVGRRTGGIPRGNKSLQLANVVSSDSDSAGEVVVSGKKRQSRFQIDSSYE